MSFDAHKNLAYSLVATAPAPAASGTSLTVTAGTGTRFPAVPFNATIWAVNVQPDPTDAEVVRVTNITGDVLTITRAQEGTSARTVIVGDQIAATITNKTLTDIENAIITPALSGSNGSFSFSTATFGNLNGLSFYSSNGSLVGSYTVPTQSVQPVAVSDSAGSFLFSTLNFSNANNVTWGTSAGNIVTASVAAQSTQPVAVSDSAGSFTFATLNFSNANNVTWGTSAGGIVTASVPSATNSSWTVSDSATSLTISRLAFTNSNGMTFTLSTAAGAATVIGSYTVPTVTNSSWTVSDAATSGTVGRLAFTNLNGVTLSLSSGAAGLHTIVGSHNAITSQSTQFMAMTLAGNTAGTTTFHATNNVSLFFNGGNNITLSGNGSTVTISAAAQTNQSAIKAFGASNTGNTAGNTGVSTGIDWVIAGTNNITVSESTAAGGPNTLWLSAPNVAAAAESNAFNLLGANTAGNTTASGSTIGLSGINITLSGTNNSQIVLSVAAQSNQSAIKAFGASNTGNTAGNTGVSTGIDWIIAGTNNITVSESTAAGGPNTLWLSAPAGGAPTLSRWNNFVGEFGRTESALAATGSSAGSWHFVPLAMGGNFPGNMTMQTLFLGVSCSHTNATASTAAKTYSIFLGIYTVSGTSTLNLLNSVSASFGTGGALANQTASWNGPRWASFVSSAWSVQPSFSQRDYYLGYMMTSAGESMAVSWMGVSLPVRAQQFSGTFGSSQGTSTYLGPIQYGGLWSASSAAAPASVHYSDLRKTAIEDLYVPLLVAENELSRW